MIQDVRTLLDQYRVWLKDRTGLREIDGWVEITTPYLDHHNDYLQVYVKRARDGFALTDKGYVLEDLKMSGCEIDSPKRKALIRMTLNGFGVLLNGQALEVKASVDDFALRKHNLVQAMLAVNDLFHPSASLTTSLFHEDVTAWLDLSRIRYTPSVKFTGKSGYDHRFDFVIPKSESEPERVLRVINRPNRDAAQAMVFAWIETKEARPAETRAYALLNDSEKTVSESVRNAMRSYQVDPILWSRRDDAVNALIA